MLVLLIKDHLVHFQQQEHGVIILMELVIILPYQVVLILHSQVILQLKCGYTFLLDIFKKFNV